VRPPREKVVGHVADHLVEREVGHPLRVAVDGVTAAGKTTFADEIAAAVRRRGRPVVRLSMDGFHHPRAHRYRQGRDSAVGYLEDAYDFPTLVHDTLVPLGADGDRRYRVRSLDLAADVVVDDWSTADADAVVVVDGTFLQRDDVAEHWDERIFLDAGFDAAADRGSVRDAEAFGGVEQARAALAGRYHAACRLYLDRVDVHDLATIVVDNNDLGAPRLVRIGGVAGSEVTLFSYGTLQQRNVQRSQFGRDLEGHADSLPGHVNGWVTITDPDVVAASGSDRHPFVRPTGDPTDAVVGTAFTLDTAELAAADRYEVDDYRRVLVRLASGTSAWVYLADDPV
jgi:uridine kinase